MKDAEGNRIPPPHLVQFLRDGADDCDPATRTWKIRHDRVFFTAYRNGPSAKKYVCTTCRAKLTLDQYYHHVRNQWWHACIRPDGSEYSLQLLRDNDTQWAVYDRVMKHANRGWTYAQSMGVDLKIVFEPPSTCLLSSGTSWTSDQKDTTTGLTSSTTGKPRTRRYTRSDRRGKTHSRSRPAMGGGMSSGMRRWRRNGDFSTFPHHLARRKS